MTKRKKLLVIAAKKAFVTEALATKLLASLENLVNHDTYETEYDGQMLTYCHDCGWLQNKTHSEMCAYIQAKNLIEEAYTTPSEPVEPATDKLLQIIAATYQIAGACDMPVHILDVLANPELATQEQIDAMLPFVQPAAKQKFCPRCGKRLGGTDDIHTCTPPVVQKEASNTTGWAPGMLQDDSRELSRWLSNKPNAKQEAREATQQTKETK